MSANTGDGGAAAHATEAELRELCGRVRDQAGAGEYVEVVAARNEGTSVKVHGGEVESLTASVTASLGIRVVVDGRVGFAHAGSLADDVVAETLAQARENVAFAEVDPHLALARPDGVEAVEQPALRNNLVASIPVEDKVARALELERRTTELDDRVTGVRVASYSDGWGSSALASTEGIDVASSGSHCSAATQPLVVADGETQIGVGWDATRDPALLDLAEIAADGVERATRLLGAVQPPSGRMPIVLEPRLAATLWGIVAGMLSGEAVVKGRSPFAERLGETVAASMVTLVDDPTDSAGLGAEEFDGEGLACRRNELISAGTLSGFLLNCTTANRLGTTSNACAVRGSRSLPGAGAVALAMEPGEGSPEGLRAPLAEALLVNTFTGLHSGVNPTSGDFSVGADGLMIRNGEVAEPVREITLASTIQRLLGGVSAIGGELERLPSGSSMPWVVIEDVSLGGA
ncbi:MAG: TldD/PmbA family protein [Microthrixaceae bacterium]|nr:TldD/PmbA family protein [Microthrixaceae bacterium]